MEQPATTKRSSFADLTLGPSQRQELGHEPADRTKAGAAAKGGAEGSSSDAAASAARRAAEAGGPSLWWVYAFAVLAAVLAGLFAVDRPRFDELAGVVADCVALRRLPTTALDNTASLMWVVLSVPVIMVLDFCVCYPLSKSHLARWYFLHAATNAIVATLSAPDLYSTLVAPHRGMAVTYCQSLPFPACSDLPTCFIVGLHLCVQPITRQRHFSIDFSTAV